MRRLALALIFVLVAQHARASCVDWRKMGKFADVDAADLVFEGSVLRIEQDASKECAPEKVVIHVKGVWKGTPATEYTLLQSTSRGREGTIDGRRTVVGSCPSSSEETRLELGRSYIVFAKASGDALRSLPCGLSQSPTPALRRRLDSWARTHEVK